MARSRDRFKMGKGIANWESRGTASPYGATACAAYPCGIADDLRGIYCSIADGLHVPPPYST